MVLLIFWCYAVTAEAQNEINNIPAGRRLDSRPQVNRKINSVNSRQLKTVKGLSGDAGKTFKEKVIAHSDACRQKISADGSQANEPDCRQMINNAELKTVVSPSKHVIEKFLVLPERDQKILCLLIAREAFIQRFPQKYSLVNMYPFSERTVDLKRGEALINEWRNLEGKDGVAVVSPQDRLIEIKEKEYWLYDIKVSRWSKVNWKEGEELFEKWRPRVKRCLLGNDASPEEIFSPDCRRVLYKRVWKKRTHLLLWLENMAGEKYAYAREIGIKCNNDESRRILRGRYDEWGHWVVEWADEGQYVFFMETGANKFYLLRFVKE